MSDKTPPENQANANAPAHQRRPAKTAGKGTASSNSGPKPPTGMAEAPHFLGHRQRLRERFTQTAGTLPDYEFLELVLFRSIARGDVKGIAKALIARFGSFAEVLSAPPELLGEVKGVGPAIIHDLKLIEQASKRVALGAIHHRQVLANYASVVDYCRTAMGFAELEEFRLLFLDKKNGLIGDEVMQRGTVDHTPVYPREIIRRALQLNASAVILVHNHPSGDPTPSRADIEMTKEIVALAEPLGVVVHDHLIVGRKGHASFRALGLL